jgi:transcription antitermination factor NusG
MMAVTTLNRPEPIALPDAEAPWFVVLTQPQQDLTTVWRLHELGLEMFVPVIRKRIPTGRRGANGHKVTRVIAKPMFPGYGFLRATADPDSLVWSDRHGTGVRGVREFLRTKSKGEVVRLPHAAVMAVYRKQTDEQQAWLAQARHGQRFVPFRRGDRVKFDEPGGAYDGLVAIIEQVIKSRGQVQVTLGSMKHWVPADKVVAA